MSEKNEEVSIKNLLVNFTKKLLFPIVVIIIVLLILAGGHYVIKEADYEDTENEHDTYETTVNDEGKVIRVQKVNKEENEGETTGESETENSGTSEETGEQEEGANNEVTAYEIAEELYKTLGEYINAEKEEAIEKLKYLIEAETVTKIPYIESNDESNDESVTGKIKFYRYNSENSGSIEETYRLTYVTPSKFEELKGKYTNSGDETIFKHFTLSSGNIKIAYGIKETRNITTNGDADLTEAIIQEKSGDSGYTGNYKNGFSIKRYSISETTIDYLSLIEQYAMPFDLLLALLIHTEDIEFVEAIASLAYETEIAIGIYDNENISYEEETYKYNKLIETTIDTNLNFNLNSIRNPNISSNSLSNLEGLKIPYNCYIELKEATQEHSTQYKNANIETATIENSLYVKEINDNGITATAKQEEAKIFELKYRKDVNAKSSPTVGIILADTWMAKWTATYSKESTTIGPYNDSGTLAREEVATYSEKSNLLNAFSNQLKNNISNNLSTHINNLKDEAVNAIYENAKDTIVVDELTVEELEESKKEEIIKNHINECEDCKDIIEDKRIADADIYKKLTIENGKLKGTTVETHYNEKLQFYVQEQNEAQRKQLEENFKKALEKEGTITYTQNVTGVKADTNISFTSTSGRTSTKYKKDQTVQRAEDGEKFAEILGKEEFHSAKQELFSSIDWFWEYIRESENTEKLEDILKYLLNKATNSDSFGTLTETEIANLFEAFEPKGQQTISSTSEFGISKYLGQFAGDNITDIFDGVEYFDFYNDTAGNPTIGPGDVQWASNNKYFNVIGTVRYGGEGGTVYENCNVLQKVNELLGDNGAQTKWDNQYQPSEAEKIYIDAETVYKATDDIQAIFWDIVIANTEGIGLSRQQLYALTYIAHATGNLDYVADTETTSKAKPFKTVYNEALNSGYEANSWEFNKYIWENWWSIKWADGYGNGRNYSGWLKALDASFETYVKGTFVFDGNSANYSREQNGYMFYSKEQILEIGFSANSTPYGLAKNRDTSNRAKEEELFTYDGGAIGTYTPDNTNRDIHGTYVSSSGRTYKEWKQASGKYTTYGDMKIARFSDQTMGAVGCGMYASTMLLNSVGLDVTPGDVCNIDNELYNSGKYVNFGTTLRKVLKDNNMGDSTAKKITSKQTLIDVLLEGRGTMTYMKRGKFTTSMHWIVLADIRITELGCESGYDVYVLTSSGPSKGGGWQTLTTVEEQLYTKGNYGFYILEP